MPNQGKVRILLNGGKRELDSATIPIEVFFDEDLMVSMKPTHVLVVEQTEAEHDSEYCHYNGRRYLFDLKRGVNFFSVSSPGNHFIYARPYGLRNASDAANLFTRSYGKHDRFGNGVTFITNGDYGAGALPIFGAKAEFEVPAEMFAIAPQTGWRKLWWNFVNMFFNAAPIDQCAYRRRMIFAPFMNLALLPLFVLLYLFLFCFATVVSSICLFFGFHVRSNLFSFSSSFDCDNYREWTTKNHEKVFVMPVTGFEVALFFGAILGRYYFPSEVNLAAQVTAWMASLGLVLLIGTIWLGRATKKNISRFVEDGAVELFKKVFGGLFASTHGEKVEVEVKDKYISWLTSNFKVDSMPSAINLATVPVYGSGVGVILRKARIKFWAVKADVCKPYAG